MHFNTLVLSGFLGLAAAASSDITSLVSQLPSCSVLCIAEGASSANCGTTDYSCQCDNQDAISSNSSTCISTSCSVSDIGTTQNVITQLCDAVSGKSTASNSTTSSTGSSSTASSTSSSSSSTSASSSSAGSHIELASLGWAAVVGVVGFVAM